MNIGSGGTVVAPAVLGTSLALTGFAFGAYVALAFMLIVIGVLLRRVAMAKAS